MLDNRMILWYTKRALRERGKQNLKNQDKNLCLTIKRYYAILKTH